MFKYRVFQLKDEHFHGKAFESYDRVRQEFGEPQRDWYDCVYELESVNELAPDDLYEIFNLRRPDDFHGHSLSVSDVVETPDGYWYCDSFGWQELDWRGA